MQAVVPATSPSPSAASQPSVTAAAKVTASAASTLTVSPASRASADQKPPISTPWYFASIWAVWVMDLPSCATTPPVPAAALRARYICSVAAAVRPM